MYYNTIIEHTWILFSQYLFWFLFKCMFLAIFYYIKLLVYILDLFIVKSLFGHEKLWGKKKQFSDVQIITTGKSKIIFLNSVL